MAANDNRFEKAVYDHQRREILRDRLETIDSTRELTAAEIQFLHITPKNDDLYGYANDEFCFICGKRGCGPDNHNGPM